MKSFVYAAVLACLMGCASNALKNSDKPEVVYNEGVRLMEDEDWTESQDFFKEIRTRFPQSRYAALAELKSADVDFRQENYDEAAAAYGSFVDLYPKHQEAPYALYQKALSYFNAAPEKIARDQSSAEDAVKTCQAFVNRYPESPLAAKAKDLLVKSRLKLAEKEAYIARFYEKKDKYKPALKRWNLMLAEFTDLKSEELAKDLMKEAEEHSRNLRKKIGAKDDAS
jgi:outer membrane protein assembly factor BamD